MKVDVNQADDRITLDSTLYDSSLYTFAISRKWWEVIVHHPASEDPPQILHTVHHKNSTVMFCTNRTHFP